MMPTLLPRPEDAGFTLIELLVVVAIIGLVALAVVPNIGRRPAGLTRAGDIAAAIGTLERARKAARESGAVQRLDPAKLIAGGQMRDTPFASGEVLIFYPDGSASGGTLAVGERGILSIDWLTGVIHAKG